MALWDRYTKKEAAAPVSPQQEVFRPKYKFSRLTNESVYTVNASARRSPAEYIHREIPAKIFEDLNIDQIPSTQFTSKGMQPTPLADYKISFDESMNMISYILVMRRSNRLREININDYNILKSFLTVLLSVMAFEEDRMIEFIKKNPDIFDILNTVLPPKEEIIPNEV